MERTFSRGLAASLVSALSFMCLFVAVNEIVIGAPLTRNARFEVWAPSLAAAIALNLLALWLKSRRLAAGDARRSQWAGTTFVEAVQAIADARRIDMTLYLRPFASTDRLHYPNPAPRHALSDMIGDDSRDLERALAEAVERDAMLIGLGRPGEHQGAARVLVSDAQWQDAVRVLAAAARRIVLLPHPTEGTMWEVDHVLGSDLRHKTVFVMPPAPQDGRDAVVASWEECRAIMRARHGIDLPAYDDGGALLAVRGDGRLETASPLAAWDPIGLARTLVALAPSTAAPPVGAEVRAAAARLMGELRIAGDGGAPAAGSPDVPPLDPEAARALVAERDVRVLAISVGLRPPPIAPTLLAACAALAVAATGTQHAIVPEPPGAPARRLHHIASAGRQTWEEAELLGPQGAAHLYGGAADAAGG